MNRPFKVTTFIVMITMVLMAYSATACRAENRARLKADKINYNYEHQLVTAEGNAVVSYRDMSIRADIIYLSVDESQMEAIGNLKITRGEEQYSGERLTYNLKEDHGIIEPLNLEIKNSNHGVLLGEGRQVEIKGNTTIIRRGTLTSCDLDHPHYHLKAAEIEFVPDVKLILRHVYYCEGFMPVFYWPYLYISLKENDSNLMTPVVGHDSQKGWFLLLGYKYFHDKLGDGILHLDLYELYGYGYGITHTIADTEKTKIQTEYYRLENQNTGLGEDKFGVQFEKQLVNQTNHSWKVKGLLNWMEEYTVLNNLEDNHYIQYNSEHKINNFQLNYYLEYKGLADQYYRDQLGQTHYYDKRYLYIRPTITWSPFKDSRLTIGGHWSDNYFPTPDDHTENYNLNLRYDQKIANHPMDLSYTRNTYESATLNIRTPATFKLGWFEKVKWDSQLYHYVPYLEPTGTQEYLNGTRFRFNIDAQSAALYQRGGFSLALSWWIKERQYWTSKGDGEQFAFSTPIIARQVFFEKKKDNVVLESLVGEFGAGWVEVDEKLPGFTSVVDSISKGGDLTYRLIYDRKRLSTSFSGGYNLTQEQWNPQSFNFRWLPNEESSVSSALRFNPKNQVQKKDTGSVTTTMLYKPTPNHVFQLNYAYYLFVERDHQTLNFSVNLEQPLGDLWTVKLNTRYDFLDENQRSTTVGLTYNWHCRKVNFTYDTGNDLYMLQYTINAFPNAKLGFNSGTGMFWDGVDFWDNNTF